MHNLVPSLNVVMASVNLENVDVLYIENGNVDRPVLKQIATILFLKRLF